MPKLFMLLVGASPEGRFIEQHDIYVGIAESIKELIPEILQWWPECKGKVHFDAWREVKQVNGYNVNVHTGTRDAQQRDPAKLFFINLGGYKQNEFEEFHYKMLIAAGNKGEAVAIAKKTAFFAHTGFHDATSHIDDKYGVDVDDVFEIADILNAATKDKFYISLSSSINGEAEDEIHLGYFKMSSFQ